MADTDKVYQALRSFQGALKSKHLYGSLKWHSPYHLRYSVTLLGGKKFAVDVYINKLGLIKVHSEGKEQECTFRLEDVSKCLGKLFNKIPDADFKEAPKEEVINVIETRTIRQRLQKAFRCLRGIRLFRFGGR